MLPNLQRPCPLCGNTGPEVLAHLNLPQLSGSPLPSGYRLLACHDCDFAYADTPASQGDYDLYYRQLAKYGGPTGTGAGLDPADLLRIKALADRLEQWLSGRNARILDIGSGAGGLLRIFRTMGYTRAEGLDPDPRAVQIARQNGLTVQEGLVSQAAKLHAGRQFDLIVLSHVAEHLHDLHSLAGLGELLAPGGTVYIEVPDPRGYHCQPRPPFYYFDSEHINHFGPNALARLFAIMGLSARSFVDCPLTLADGSTYPAVAAVAQLNGEPLPLPRDTLVRLRTYIEESRLGLTAQFRIAPPLATKPILVWGAGSWAQRLLGQRIIPLEQVCAFLDAAPNKQGQQLAGKPVLAPAEGLSQYPDAQVLVCIAVNPRQVDAEVARLSLDRPRSLHFISEHP